MTDAFVCDAVRTPFGRYGGALATVRTDDLAAIPLAALRARNASVDWTQVDDVILGCANQAGEDNRNVARMASLLAGLPETVAATTVNRLCASSLDATLVAARAIRAGEAELVIAGGVESMSRAPYVIGKAETAFSRGVQSFDTTIGWRFVNPAFAAVFGTDSMPETAENVAAECAISRVDQDSFAWRSQQRTERARRAGAFADELVPVVLPAKNGEAAVVTADEHPRPDVTPQTLARLAGIVRPDGTVTAGNASGINDGACALLIASESAIERFGLRPLARIAGGAAAGVPPRIMGIGPVPATRKIMHRLGLTPADLGVIEVNEAFAAQALAVVRALGIADDDARLNPNGGAIALGHPLGASGARLIMSAAYELRRNGGRYALCTMCVGVGQGLAVVLERVT